MYNINIIRHLIRFMSEHSMFNEKEIYMDSMYSVSAQGAGAMVGHFNQMRMDEFIRNINYQDINLDHAMNEINEARKFIKKPSEILGCDRTKFGEVAEHLEVAFKNADELIVGNPAPATFNGVGRTAPEDFWSMVCQFSQNLCSIINPWML